MEQRLQVAGGDIFAQRRQGLTHAVEQLRGVHRAEGVRREVAEGAVGPVNILHAAVAVVADGVEAEISLHLLIPQRRNVFHLDIAFDQRFFNFVAQDDVGRIAHLVGVDADQARFNALVEANKVGLFQRRLFAKLRGDQRTQDLQEFIAARQLHFEQQALRFMDSGGTSQGDRLAEQIARQVLLVAGVAGFVHDAEQRGQKLFLVVTRGDAHIFRHAAAERVGADVDAAVVEVETEQLHHAEAQLALGVHIERTLRRLTGLVSLFGHHALQQIR